MNDYYFMYVISRLTDEDIKLLEILQSQDAVLSYKAITKTELIKLSNLSEAIFRKSLTRLTSIVFAELVVGSKHHPIFITQYGQTALQRAKTPNYLRR